jgi:pimeloyl-ACP methyl ester carboxylesterase
MLENNFKFEGKDIAWDAYGDGDQTLFLLYGNTFSARMFDQELEFYKHYAKTIVLDYTGHGDSEPVDELPVDFWHYNARIIIELIKEQNFQNVNLIGTSGGALVALNAGLEAPGLIKKIVADSFAGEKMPEEFAQKTEELRDELKRDPNAAEIWRYFHGNRWNEVLDADTKMIKEFAKMNKSFFHKDLSELEVPVLLTGSAKDDQIAQMPLIIEHLANKIPNAEKNIYDEGHHPAMMSNVMEFRGAALNFFEMM